ncbi:MAG: acetyltransferase [Thiohalophilus sp.]
MKGILLAGGGGHCKSVIDVIETAAEYRIEGIVQPARDGDTPVLGYPIIGEDEDLPELGQRIPNAIVTVGQIKSAALRRDLFDSLKALNFTMPRLISPRAYVSPHAEIEEGTVIMHGAVINPDARLGANGIINSMALVEHDVVIRPHCHISTGARINGNVVVGEGCFIGSGAVLHENIRIGANCIIGAGCVVAADIEPDTVMKFNR